MNKSVSGTFYVYRVIIDAGHFDRSAFINETVGGLHFDEMSVDVSVPYQREACGGYATIARLYLNVS